MSNSRIREWLEILGLFGVISSLIFVGLELRQSRQIAYMDQLAVARQMVSEFRQNLIDNRDIWYRGCGGQELTETERLVFTQLALEFRDTVTTLYARGNIGIYASSSRWMDNLAANLHRYPAIQRAIANSDAATFRSSMSNDLPEFAGGAFIGLFDSISARLEEIENLEPDASAPLYLCGNL